MLGTHPQHGAREGADLVAVALEERRGGDDDAPGRASPAEVERSSHDAHDAERHRAVRASGSRLSDCVDVGRAERGEAQPVADSDVQQRRQALADGQLVDDVEASSSPVDDPRPVDLGPETAVDLRSTREELVGERPRSRDQCQLLELPDGGDARNPPQLVDLRGGDGAGVELDVRRPARLLEARQRALGAARAGDQREHHRAREGDEQREHDRAAPPTTQIRERASIQTAFMTGAPSLRSASGVSERAGDDRERRPPPPRSRCGRRACARCGRRRRRRRRRA